MADGEGFELGPNLGPRLAFHKIDEKSPASDPGIAQRMPLMPSKTVQCKPLKLDKVRPRRLLHLRTALGSTHHDRLQRNGNRALPPRLRDLRPLLAVEFSTRPNWASITSRCEAQKVSEILKL
jgi:hypothetical protein